MKKLITRSSLLFALATWVLLNCSALISLHWRWIKLDEAYAIGYPVCAIALWLMAKQYRQISADVAPALSAALLFLAAVAIGQAARLVQFQLLQQLIVPVSLWLLVAAAVGWRSAKVVLFPFALLYLAIPFWDVLVPVLRRFTVVSTQHVLGLLKVPAYILGYEIILPSGKIIVEDGCSGLNLFLAATVIGLLQSHLMTQRQWRRVVTILLAVTIGVVDNWIRVIIIVLIAHATDMRSPLVYHHGNLGWAVFAVSLIPFFIVTHWLERGDHWVQVPVAVTRRATSYGRTMLSTSVAAVGGLAVLASAVLLERQTGTVAELPAPPLAAAIQPIWLPDYKGYDRQQAWRVYRDGVDYQIVALTYWRQTADKKLIYYSNRIAAEEDTLATTKFIAGDSLRINQSVINAEGARVVWWFYLIDQHVVTGGIAAKWQQFLGILRGDQRASLVTISMSCLAADCSDILQSDQTSQSLRGLLDEWLSLLGVTKR